VEGTVWRAWWSASTFTWEHLPEGYAPFGRFSSVGMLKPGSTIAAYARSDAFTNLIAIDGQGSIVGEFLEDGLWNPGGIPWGATVDTAWGPLHEGKGLPNSVPAMLGNVGVEDSLEVYWIDVNDLRTRLQIWTARGFPIPTPERWAWVDPSRIDGIAF